MGHCQHTTPVTPVTPTFPDVLFTLLSCPTFTLLLFCDNGVFFYDFQDFGIWRISSWIWYSAVEIVLIVGAALHS